MKRIVLAVSDSLKFRLDELRLKEGYTLCGFIRSAVERALNEQQPKPRRKGKKAA